MEIIFPNSLFYYCQEILSFNIRDVTKKANTKNYCIAQITSLIPFNAILLPSSGTKFESNSKNSEIAEI